jgi:hypothetical protein
MTSAVPASTAVTAPVHSTGASERRCGGVARRLFGLHFVEMAIAMEIGMMPLGYLLSALGQSDLSSRSPEAYSLAMNLSMVLPMAAWMLIRRHGLRLTADMAAAMILPGAIVAAASLGGFLAHTAAVWSIGALM